MGERKTEDLEVIGSIPIGDITYGSLAEWLTRCPAKALPYRRAGSNPAAVVVWGCSSNGRALALHARGTGIDAQLLQMVP